MCFHKVLFIGPDYKDLPASCFGPTPYFAVVGSLLDLYHRHIEPASFKFIASYKEGMGDLFNLSVFIRCALSLCVRLFVDRQIKIVHIHVGKKGEAYRSFLLFVLARYVFKRKVVYHAHKDAYCQHFPKESVFRQSLMSRLVNQVDMVICISTEALTYFKGNFKPRLVFIVNEAVDTVDNEINPFVDGDLIKFLFLGRVSNADINSRISNKIKVRASANDESQLSGLTDLLELMEKNKRLYKGRMVLLIGDWTQGNGQLKRKIKRLMLDLHNQIREKRLEGMVAFLRCPTYCIKDRLLPICNVCIAPSSQPGAGRAVLEAMNYGMPVVARTGGLTGEIVLHGINGFLSPPSDKCGLEKAINHYLRHPKDIDAMGAQSRLLTQNYQIQDVLLNLKLIYLNLLN